MEVDKIAFYPLLLDLLTEISEARFVAFDLELSGVPSQFAKSDNGSKPTLQQRYENVKEAAERYQILQIGLTPVYQDLENHKYVLRPYNFELNPIIPERKLDIERIFSFQSGAVDFLLQNGFDFSVPFKDGVPFLSREESRQARTKFEARQDKHAIADIQIKPTETESLAFLERVRGLINDWLTSRNKDEYINIDKAQIDHLTGNTEAEELTRFEKRLVHQLVRSEYPDLVTLGKKGFIQIVHFDKQREDKLMADRRKELNAHINKQKGFRWVIEALHGASIAKIDLDECAKDSVTGEKIVADMPAMKTQFYRAQSLLRDRPRVMVGHNCFLDLVYIYRHFIGPLPATVESFQRKIHDLWPTIIDTKYMSTHNCSDINPISSLETIAAQLSAQQRPILEIDEDHMKYSDATALHEAGYDSFLTAQIAVRLSTKLDQAGCYSDAQASASESSESTVTGPASASNGYIEEPQTEESAPWSGPVVYMSREVAEGFTPSIEGGKWKRRGDPTLPPADPDGIFTYNPTDLVHRSSDPDADKTFAGGMPKASSDFWNVYGNKLRVFGTAEGVCMLDGTGQEEEGKRGRRAC